MASCVPCIWWNLACEGSVESAAPAVWVSLSVTRSSPGVPGRLHVRLQGPARLCASPQGAIQGHDASLPSFAPFRFPQKPPAYGSCLLVRKVQDVVFFSFNTLFICKFTFCWHHAACGILVPWPGMEPVPPALEAWRLYCTTLEVPPLVL